MAMIVRRFKRFIGKKKRFYQKFHKKGEISKDRDKEKSKEKDQVSAYCECKKLGHFRQDCPLLKKASIKKMKKALFGAWSDDEVLSSSDEEEIMNTVNLCLMVLEEEEVLSPNLQYKFTFDELNSAFLELTFEFKKAGSRIKTLKDLNEMLQKEKDKILDENKVLKKELNALSKNYSELEKEKNSVSDLLRQVSVLEHERYIFFVYNIQVIDR